MRILLFDIDGVLVKPFGYRKAYFETCKWIIEKGNLNINLPADDIPALFESYGVTCEWDMLAISACIMLNNISKENQLSLNSITLNDALEELSRTEKNLIEIDFRSQIQSMSEAYHINEIPSVGLLQSSEKYISGMNRKLAYDILNHTRSADLCLITRVFQNFVLGTKTFEQTYQLKSLFESDSYLSGFDQALLSEQMKAELVTQRELGNILFIALTARPSLQPRGAQSAENIDYSPEAELALDVINMPDMPLIGFGRLQYIGKEIDVSADLLIKPDPFHSLAAIFSMLGESEVIGLEAAGELRESNVIPGWVNKKIEGELNLSVFEDSPGGIRSVISAAQKLNQLGIQTNVNLYGVTTNQDKQKSLNSLGAKIFPDINAALKCEFNL